jgi:hypothetical protein
MELTCSRGSHFDDVWQWKRDNEMILGRGMNLDVDQPLERNTRSETVRIRAAVFFFDM